MNLYIPHWPGRWLSSCIVRPEPAWDYLLVSAQCNGNRVFSVAIEPNGRNDQPFGTVTSRLGPFGPATFFVFHTRHVPCTY
jgi:hypothetical protein